MDVKYMELQTSDRELKKGSAELLILSLLEARPRHGYDIGRLIGLRSGGALHFHVASLYPLLYRKYYVDEIYDSMFVNRAKDLGTTLALFDSNVIDGMGVDGAGLLTRFSSQLSILWDTWIVDGLVNLTARIVWLFSYPVRMVQTGLVSSYALLIVLGVLIFLAYYLRAVMH